MKIQLLTFPGCPNAEAARERLRSVLASSGIGSPIEEVDTTGPDTPEPLRGWGSPTVLIDGKDVGGQEAPTGASCRLYRDGDGRHQGMPSEALLRAALVG
jgi:mercuric ion transport protein